MRWKAAVLLAGMLALLALPLALRRGDATPQRDGPTLVVITPHTQQIRDEFAIAFARWHEQNFGEPANVDWRTPGGTSEIRRLLQDQYRAALNAGEFGIVPGALGEPFVEIDAGRMGYDILFGGGSYEHGQIARGVRIAVPEGVPGAELAGGAGAELAVPISVPAGFTPQQLDGWYGENAIGSERLYHPKQYWLGTALSSFGILYNKDLYRERGLEPPRAFEDLTDPQLAGMVALADPRQSGSITTTFESILNAYDWDEGWRILREMAANTRYFTNAATKPPLDVAAGEAMAGLAIDFYGRTQSQSVVPPGAPASASRVGYVDPVGAVYIDADPISILRGAPHPELARRFVEFTLTEQAQSLWQFPANPDQTGPPPTGPVQYELRRAPVRRVMYERHADRFIDELDPFNAAADVENRGWRSSISIMMGAFGVDSDEELQRAWAALNELRAMAATDPAFESTLREAEAAFYAFPSEPVTGEDGAVRELVFSAENYRPVRNAWRDPERAVEAQIEYTRFFRDRYREVVKLARDAARRRDP
ncbi:MAG: extracellular solute-binding protein [Planctomycetota bacterium]